MRPDLKTRRNRDDQFNSHQSRFNMCSKKKRYRDEEEAKRAKTLCLKMRPTEHLYVYECPSCHGYHLSGGRR